MEKIDLKSASTQAIQKAIGESLKAHLKQKPIPIAEFAENAGIPRTTVYRIFRGETVGTDSFIAVLQALNRFDVLGELITEPRPSPLDIGSKGFIGGRVGTPKVLSAPRGFDLSGAARRDKHPRNARRAALNDQATFGIVNIGKNRK